MAEDHVKAAYAAVLNGDLEGAREQVRLSLAGGLAADRLLKDGLIAAMGEVGRLFEAGEFYVPEMLVAARAMKGCLEILRPLLVDSDVKPVGTVVIGTVSGDLHDIGKNLVAMMLEGAGFEVHDLGVDVSPQKFVEAVQATDPDIVAMSALLTTTMAEMEATVNAPRRAEVLDKARILVGGAPVNAAFAEKIGADGYAPDASQASAVARRLVAAKG
ncbi:MAG: methyltransferase [Chloroflexi bacterium RBG_13_68_17]|nr:MAG: methyltransferase [Chloroflexi bacterium RBG_13_68_17]